MAEKTRYYWIDYLKGLGILLIVFAHCTLYFPTMSSATGWACSFHVPIFFIASGCLAYYQRERNISNKESIIKKAKTLLIPYVIFSLFNSVLKLGVLFIAHNLTKEIIHDEMIQLLITGNGTVWFLLTLFFVEVITILLNIKKYPSIVKWAISIALLVIPFILPQISNPFGIVLERTMFALGFYIFGFQFCSLLKKDFLDWKIGLILIVYAFVIYCIFGSNYSFFDNIYKNIFGSLSCSLCFSCGLAMIFKSLEKGKKITLNIINYFGKNSLIVMLIHPTILLCFTYKFGEFFGSLNGIISILASLALFIIVLLLNVPFNKIINEKLPFLIGKSKRKKVSTEIK